MSSYSSSSNETTETPNLNQSFNHLSPRELMDYLVLNTSSLSVYLLVTPPYLSLN